MKQEVIESFEKRGLHILDNEEYKNVNTKIDCVDDNGYLYSLSWYTVRSEDIKHFNTVTKYNKFSIQNIQTYINSMGSETNVLEKEYINEKQKLELICECGNKYYNTWNHIHNGNAIYCQQCNIDNKNIKQCLSFEDVDKICKKYQYELLELNKTKSIIVKDKYGYKYKTSLSNLKNNIGYGGKKFSPLNPFAIENIINYIKINNIPTKLVDETPRTINKNTKIGVYCNICGNIHYVSVENIVYSNNPILICKECNNRQSKLEIAVKEYLKQIDVDFIEQKRFDDCRNKRPLPFDFYLPKYNVCIEVQGQQHYYESKNTFTMSLEERKRLDKIKYDYCVDNNIKYLSIPFWNINNKQKTYIKQINNILN